ncbi:MAG: hypothetical protein ACREV7_00105 [Steroidobacteraceae bacterium]
MPYALVSLLGLEPDALEHRLRIVDPRLPPGVDRLSLTRVRVGEGLADLSFLRSSDDNVGVSWSVRQGPLIIESVPRRNTSARRAFAGPRSGGAEIRG